MILLLFWQQRKSFLPKTTAKIFILDILDWRAFSLPKPRPQRSISIFYSYFHFVFSFSFFCVCVCVGVLFVCFDLNFIPANAKCERRSNVLTKYLLDTFLSDVVSSMLIEGAKAKTLNTFIYILMYSFHLILETIDYRAGKLSLLKRFLAID